MHISSTSKMISHPSYQAVVEMGYDVVPLLLRDLQENRRFWFYALTQITGENPIDPRDAGRIDKMIAAWIEWGQNKGIVF